MNSIAIVDYGMGNLRSVAKAVEHVAPKARVQVTSDAVAIGAADRVVFPGQGAMPEGESEPITEPVGFTFDFGDDVISIDMQYEEMDGMYAAYFPTDALIVGYLRSKDSVAVDAPSGPWPVQEFTLEGSSKAIAAVLRSCN